MTRYYRAETISPVSLGPIRAVFKEPRIELPKVQHTLQTTFEAARDGIFFNVVAKSGARRPRRKAK